MKPHHAARISPTAHYTSYVWFRNGLSHAALTTRTGHALHLALRPMNLAYERVLRRTSLDEMLLARHRALDHLLARAIERGEISQVLEVAGGFSARGLRFAARYAHRGLVYVEGDLPAQAARKRAALEAAGLRGEHHRVVALDALAAAGPESLAAVAAAHFDPARGLAIVTEGLLGYFSRADVEGMWGRLARTLEGFPSGLYLSDLNLAGDVAEMRSAAAFRFLLQAFARGRVHLHYPGPLDAAEALRRTGFGWALVHSPHDLADEEAPPPRARPLVRLVEAGLGPAPTR